MDGQQPKLLMSDNIQNFYELGVALAIGLLIGLERGWHLRKAKEGERIAGVRTYGLIALFGGGSALLGQHLGQLVVVLALLALAGVLIAAYVVNLRDEDDVSITSLVAALLTFVFGALAVSGEMTIAAASAVVTTLLLVYKPVLHRWVSALSAEELHAGIQLLLISVVLLPILPDKGYGPWQVLNPYAIWWMVVLIAAISFVGYFGIRIGGARKGIAFTGLFAGLASSTAVTLHFSRLARKDPAAAPLLSTGILLSCGTMFPRMLLVASMLNTDLFKPLLVPVVVMALIVYSPALFYYNFLPAKSSDVGSALKNPLELKPALAFGGLLVLVLLLGEVLQNSFGDEGVLFLAAASGVADVDAITLSLSRMSTGDLAVNVAAMGVVVAAAANSLIKGGIAAMIGGRQTLVRVGLPLLFAAAGGLIAAWLWVW